MKSKYSIGEMSKLFNIPVSTLRHYHNKGIFLADCIDGGTNYRYYSSEQFELLNNIINLRYGRVSLEKIKELTTEGDLGSLVEAFTEQEKELQEKVEELEKAKQSIENRRKYLEVIKELKNYGEVRVEKREEETIFSIMEKFKTEEQLELLVRELGNKSDFSYSLVLGNVGLIMKKKKNYIEYDGVYLKNIRLAEEKSEKKESGRYLVVYFEGSRSDSNKYYKLIEEYSKEKNVAIGSNYYEMALVVKKENPKRYIRKIEVKIK